MFGLNMAVQGYVLSFSYNQYHNKIHKVVVWSILLQSFSCFIWVCVVLSHESEFCVVMVTIGDVMYDVGVFSVFFFMWMRQREVLTGLKRDRFEKIMDSVSLAFLVICAALGMIYSGLINEHSRIGDTACGITKCDECPLHVWVFPWLALLLTVQFAYPVLKVMRMSESSSNHAASKGLRDALVRNLLGCMVTCISSIGIGFVFADDGIYLGHVTPVFFVYFDSMLNTLGMRLCFVTGGGGGGGTRRKMSSWSRSNFTAIGPNVSSAVVSCSDLAE